MRRLLHFISLLYPAQWRARYGDEFQALLEQSDPRWNELVNLSKRMVFIYLSENNSRWKT